MARAAADTFGSRLACGLQIGTRLDHVVPGFEFVPGSHPVPSSASESAGRRALAVARGMRAGEHLVVLLSGGASALMAVPAAGLTLDDKRGVTTALLRAGADIHALNTVRKHLSAIKGGQLAALSAAPTTTLAISDVVGDDVSVIGSGPTVADASQYRDALEVLSRLGVAALCPPRALAHLTRGAAGDVPETPKAGDPRLSASTVRVIAGRRDAMHGAAAEARARGYDVHVIDEPIEGEARVAALGYWSLVNGKAAARNRPTAVVSSGETTVHVRGHGRGGRNQELALALADSVGGAAPTLVASLGTDGIDGPTDAAGAIVDSTTAERAARAGLGDPRRFLDDNDAYAFFAALGDLIQTGPSGTNVGDLQIALFG